MDKRENLKMNVNRKCKAVELIKRDASSLTNDAEKIQTMKKKCALQHAEQNTCSVGTVLEPECLGPCEPGTSISLEGIIWLETCTGMLVVNVTWRGRTYVGTLLDSSQHTFAPPPPAEHNARTSLSSSAVKRRRRQCNLPIKRKQTQGTYSSSTDAAAGTPPLSNRVLNDMTLNCPHPNCSKRFANVTALKFHHNDSHARMSTTKDGVFKIPPSEHRHSTSKLAKFALVSANRREATSDNNISFNVSSNSDVGDDNNSVPILECVTSMSEEVPSEELCQSAKMRTMVDSFSLLQPPPLISACLPHPKLHWKRVAGLKHAANQNHHATIPTDVEKSNSPPPSCNSSCNAKSNANNVNPLLHVPSNTLYRATTDSSNMSHCNAEFRSPQQHFPPESNLYELAEMRDTVSAVASFKPSPQLYIHRHSHLFRHEILNSFVGNTESLLPNQLPATSISLQPQKQFSSAQ